MQNIRESLGGIFDSFMMLMTALGEAPVAFLLMAAVYWCLDKRSGQLMGLNSAFGCALNQFLKSMFKVDRPWVRDERVTPVEDAIAGAPGYSFPSGHTQRATATWGALGASLWRKKERIAAVICWVVLALIGFSRNYLGVHTPQDVLVSLAVGIILIFVLNKVLTWTDRGSNRDIIVAAVGCVLCVLSIIIAGWTSNAGLGIGILIGWVLERHFVRFDTTDTFINKCVRFAIGGAGAWYILKPFQQTLKLMISSSYAECITMFIMAIFIMVLYPFFFAKRERYKAGIAAVIIIFAATPVAAAVFS